MPKMEATCFGWRRISGIASHWRAYESAQSKSKIKLHCWPWKLHGPYYNDGVHFWCHGCTDVHDSQDFWEIKYQTPLSWWGCGQETRLRPNGYELLGGNYTNQGVKCVFLILSVPVMSENRKCWLEIIHSVLPPTGDFDSTLRKCYLITSWNSLIRGSFEYR